MDLKNIITHMCGCRLELDGDRWIIKKHCSVHEPDYQKKADKLMRRKDRKRGRGYTKSPKKLDERK